MADAEAQDKKPAPSDGRAGSGQGRAVGRFQPTGTVPRIVERLRARGIKFPMEVFAAPSA